MDAYAAHIRGAKHQKVSRAVMLLSLCLRVSVFLSDGKVQNMLSFLDMTHVMFHLSCQVLDENVPQGFGMGLSNSSFKCLNLSLSLLSTLQRW